MNNYIHYVQDDRYYADSSYSNYSLIFTTQSLDQTVI